MQGDRLRLIMEVRERILCVGRWAIGQLSVLASSECRLIESAIRVHGCQLRGLILVWTFTIRGSAFVTSLKIQQVGLKARSRLSNLVKAALLIL